MDSVQWDDGPALPRHHTAHQVRNLSDGNCEYYRLLCAPQCVHTHWVTDTNLRPQGRTLPCFGSQCKYCPDRRKLQAYGAAIVWNRTSDAPTRKGQSGGFWSTCILPIPQEAWFQLLEDLSQAIQESHEIWRGLALEVSRKGKRTRIVVCEHQITDTLPDAFDVKPSLLRMWGITEKFVAQKTAGSNGVASQTIKFPGNRRA